MWLPPQPWTDEQGLGRNPHLSLLPPSEVLPLISPVKSSQEHTVPGVPGVASRAHSNPVQRGWDVGWGVAQLIVTSMLRDTDFYGKKWSRRV